MRVGALLLVHLVLLPLFMCPPSSLVPISDVGTESKRPLVSLPILIDKILNVTQTLYLGRVVVRISVLVGRGRGPLTSVPSS